jgi:SOS response regulatory protein OraA/RecX
VLDRFEATGYLDDVEYASVYISHRIPKGYTFRRISRELSELGVSKEQSEAGLARFIEEQGYDPTAEELQRGREQARKIIGTPATNDSKLLAKAGRKLVALGYTSDTVYAILGEYMRGVSE